MLVNTCDMIRSNHRSYISLILFLIICLEDKVQISYSEEMNRLKQRIDNQNREKEIYSQAPGYEELKRTHDLFVMKHFEKKKSWTDEVANLKDQLKTMTTQNRKTKDEEVKNTKLQNEIRAKEREIMELKEKLKNVQEQNNEKIGEVKNDASQNEEKVKEMERKYREEKIKIELEQEIDNATELFNVLDEINDELKDKNERYSGKIEGDMRYRDTEIADGEELFTVIDGMNDKLIAENEDLKERNEYLELENRNSKAYIVRLELDEEAREDLWGKFSESDKEEMEISTGEFFEVMDDMMDAKDKKF